MEIKLTNYIKEQVNEKLKDLDWDNLDESYEEIKKYYHFLLKIKKAQDKNPNFSLSPSYHTGSSLYEYYDAKENRFIGQVKYLLSGGELGSFKLFIPESILRDEGIKEGDWVEANVKERREIHGIPRVRYFFQRISPGEIENPFNRQMEEYLVILTDQYGAQYIEFEKDGEMIKIYVTEENSGNFTLEEGDLVDYAYLEDDYFGGRIIWRHFVDMSKLRTPRKSSFYKRNNRSERNYTEEWANKKIAVIGFESNKNSFEEEVITRGGIFRHFTGDERLESLTSQLIETDLIVVFVDSIGHDGMFKIRAVAKNLDIPVEYSPHLGRSSFVSLVNDYLE